jgi:hypothetical protein
MNLRDRLRALADRREAEPVAVEEALRDHFRFLVEDQGFEMARSDRLPDGAMAAYKNVPAQRAVMVFARAGKGAWAGIGSLDSEGRMKALDQEAIEQGKWRTLGQVHLGSGVGSLREAIERLAESLRVSRA